MGDEPLLIHLGSMRPAISSRFVFLGILVPEVAIEPAQSGMNDVIITRVEGVGGRLQRVLGPWMRKSDAKPEALSSAGALWS